MMEQGVPTAETLAAQQRGQLSAEDVLALEEMIRKSEIDLDI
jgi:hypothetical protein